MQRRELRPKRELLSLLQRLNDYVSISTRRMYTQQVTSTEMLQRPLSDYRRLYTYWVYWLPSCSGSLYTTKHIRRCIAESASKVWTRSSLPLHVMRQRTIAHARTCLLQDLCRLSAASVPGTCQSSLRTPNVIAYAKHTGTAFAGHLYADCKSTM